MLHGKRILIGISGGIAAYKITYLIRLLIKEGAEVQVIATRSALDFVTPLTLSTLSKNPILTEYFHPETGEWNNHVELGKWADLYVIVPLTANSLAKMAHGQSDNLLLTTYLSATCPVFFAPAMDLDMFKHSTTQKNIALLKARGDILIPPTEGELASGLHGEGRMAEPEDILEQLHNYFERKGPLSGKKVLITAGPTFEPIDPVRFIGNRSSGKMGYALAKEAVNLGADVILVSGPVNIEPPQGLKLIKVESSAEMYEACLNVQDYDLAVLAAAVADYKVKKTSSSKIKKSSGLNQLDLVETQDILKHLGKHKKKNQLLVGFALETDNELKNALDKLQRKNLDFIILNSLSEQHNPFNSDQNKIIILQKDNKRFDFELKDKLNLAKDIFSVILK